ITQAARFAHRGGIVHRDLKPQNVMVDSDDRAVVTDFGIARAGASGVTEAGSVLGTAHYISPEQAQGQDVGARSDVYSIGVVLYEMLTAKVPFDADSPVAIAMKHVGEAPQPPSAVVPGISPDLDAVVLWSLNKQPGDRPADAEALAHALEAIGERLRAAGDTAATVAFAVPTAATAVAATPAQPEEANGEEPPEEEESSNRKWWIAAGVLAVVAALAAAFFLTRPNEVTMPLVVGKDLQTARTIISNAGVTSDPVIQREQSSRPVGEVIAQKPLAGAKVAEDGKVTLVASAGPGSTVVPSVTELSEQEASALLRKSGFKVEVRRRSDSDVKKGFSIATDPAAGTSLPRGTTVALIVSSGVGEVSVPSVVGQNVDDARSALMAAGLVVSTTKQQTTDQPEGTVLSQDPSGGTSVEKGSTVTLAVAVAPPKVAVPDVLGRTQADAVARIRSAGFVATVVTVEPPAAGCTDADFGNVVDQDPPGDSQADKGSRVKISICTDPGTP
ncbi:MAG: PASTA domain-containing protein, partial [Actinomycetes bacterium]